MGVSVGDSASGVESVQPVLDLAVLRALVGNDAEVIREIVEAFVASLRPSVAAATLALASGDLVTARAIGHRLKSSARSVGALPLGDVCEALEYVSNEASVMTRNHLEFALQVAVAQVVSRAGEVGFPVRHDGASSPG